MASADKPSEASASNADQLQFKPTLIYILIGSVILGAVLGIFVVLRNTWGRFEIQVILSTVVLAAGSLCGLACDLSLAQNRARSLSLLGMGLTLISCLMLLTGIWFEKIDHEVYWKACAIVSVVTVATVHICLLSNAQLADSYHWVFVVAVFAIGCLTLQICFMIVDETQSPPAFRFLAAMGILVVALSLVIPLLHRVSRTSNGIAVDESTTDPTLQEIDSQIGELRQRIADLEKRRSKLIVNSAKQK